jgi:hypothetical protein
VMTVLAALGTSLSIIQNARPTLESLAAIYDEAA